MNEFERVTQEEKTYVFRASKLKRFPQVATVMFLPENDCSVVQTQMRSWSLPEQHQENQTESFVSTIIVYPQPLIPPHFIDCWIEGMVHRSKEVETH